MSTEKTVYIAGVHRKRYHTSATCPSLPTYDREALPEAEAIAQGLTPCGTCAPRVKCNAYGCINCKGGHCLLSANQWGGEAPQRSPIDGCIEYVPRLEF